MKQQQYEDAAAVAAAAAAMVADSARHALAERGRFRMVLAGGTTPEATYRLLATEDLGWPDWELYFGDERCLPSDDPQRNSRMVAKALTDHVAIPENRIHRISAELGAEPAAQAYRALLPAEPFDLVLHGMGEDGHTASLFPGRELDEQAQVMAVYDAPKPPPERVSLGLAALRHTRAALVMVTGAGKRAALAQWLKADQRLPVARVCEGVHATLLFDRDAAE